MPRNFHNSWESLSYNVRRVVSSACTRWIPYHRVSRPASNILPRNSSRSSRFNSGWNSYDRLSRMGDSCRGCLQIPMDGDWVCSYDCWIRRPNSLWSGYPEPGDDLLSRWSRCSTYSNRWKTGQPNVSVGCSFRLILDSSCATRVRCIQCENCHLIGSCNDHCINGRSVANGERGVLSELHLIEECPHTRSDIPRSETERYSPQENVNGFRSRCARNVNHEGFSLGSWWIVALSRVHPPRDESSPLSFQDRLSHHRSLIRYVLTAYLRP